jgi:hypothetical protein
MALLYSNENFPLPAVIELRRLGHDVLTNQETGKADQATTDDQVLAFATAQGRAVLTLNRKHFIKLHDRSPQHAGIVVCTVDVNFVALAGRINAAITEAGDLAGNLVRVHRPAR